MLLKRILFLVAGSVVVLGPIVTSSQTTSRSVNDGVYSTDQAARGETVYKAKCGSCHYQAQFTGEDLMKAWAGKPLSELFDAVRSMPEDNPGSLPVQEYADVIAFFLQLNKYPAGSDELPGADEAMRAILMEPPK